MPQEPFDHGVPKEGLRGSISERVEHRTGAARVAEGEVAGDEEGGDEDVAAEAEGEGARVEGSEEGKGEGEVGNGGG